MIMLRQESSKIWLLGMINIRDAIPEYFYHSYRFENIVTVDRDSIEFFYFFLSTPAGDDSGYLETTFNQLTT